MSAAARALRSLAALALLAPAAAAAEGPRPIRGAVPIPETTTADAYRMERGDRVIPRNHAWQPPVIPHHVRGYQITSNVNMCMSCHSRKAAAQTGATVAGKSHYLDRDGKELANISARRYFCLQCHVPQYNAEALVGNDFRGPR
ncbi:MAG TPA: nitrate reductase cytochrome c-type subunit [Burkholderiales bacterium]